MFTGLVEIMGTVVAKTLVDTSVGGGNGFTLVIGDAHDILDDCKLGDSIAINGVCLTVTVFDAKEGTFKVGLAPETLRKTNLGDLQVGEKVNLERAMSATTRFGGHFVQAHVDCTIDVVSVTVDPPNSLIYRFHVPKHEIDYLTYIVSKGYVCLDGTSLTVIDVDVQKREFTVMLIPHTQERVIMPSKKQGSKVNLEVDQLGKYVERQILSMLQAEHSPVSQLVENLVKKFTK
ncbi:hypothetical protein EDD86DRAFT_244781 [Gorgonomyces haynaldii]|nr:hypothetical protein EDD86DRAFT_244781 [Gorgonomyces haynaldii]